MGATFRTQQEEANQAILEIGQIMPEIIAQSADIILSNIDAPNMSQIQERVRDGMVNNGAIPVDQLTEEEMQKLQMEAQQQEQGGQDPMAELIEQQQQLEAMKMQMDAQQKSIELAQKELSANADAQLKVAQTRKTMADAEQVELENDALEAGITELAAKIIETR